MITSKNLIFFLLATLAAAEVSAAVTSPNTTLEPEDSNCPWRRVANVNEPTIQGYGSWALQQEPISLHFLKVESATAQAVGNCENNIERNYALIILAEHRPSATGEYKAVIYVESIPITLISLEAVLRHRPPPAN